MRNYLNGSTHVIAAILLLTIFRSPAQPVAFDFSPQPVLTVMQRVADWQLAHPPTNRPTSWIEAAGDDGLMALAGISGDAKYRDAMLAKGETNRWELPKHGGRLYHADDQCIGQVWAELYFLHREPKMIAPMRERFDFILANPSTATNLNFSQPKGKAQELWSWCDALFMAPPAWLRLYVATGEEKYLNFAVTNWWRTTDYLYNPDEHLFFRDSTFFKKPEANGKKIFWSRGNGWVFAGIVRMLNYLPTNHPDRPRFEKLFQEMAAKILTLQQADGLWRSSLLDPQSYPLKETSGSGFFTYGFAWGVNQGLLNRATYEPAVRKAWTALTACVEADGKLTHVQPVGADPKKFAADSTEAYGVGAFLLAGSEVYRMAVLAKTVPVSMASGMTFVKPMLEITISNPSPFRRVCETVEMNLQKVDESFLSRSPVSPPAPISAYVPEDLKHRSFALMDGVSSRILDSQVYASQTNQPLDKLLFQVDLAPRETRTFYILDASALPAVPPPIVKTYAPENPARRFPAPRDPPLQVTVGN